MKFRIVQLHNGKYRIQNKCGFFDQWKFASEDAYNSYQEADDIMHDRISSLRHFKNDIKGNEICKVVEVEHV